MPSIGRLVDAAFTKILPIGRAPSETFIDDSLADQLFILLAYRQSEMDDTSGRLNQNPTTASQSSPGMTFI